MVRIKDLTDYFYVSRSTIYRWIGDLIPEPHYFKGTKIPYWYAEEITAKVPNFTEEALAKLREVREGRKAAKKTVKIAM